MRLGKAPAIGIDLGTTYSCVAIFQNGNVETIDNDDGSSSTPSYVAFSETERLIGEAARSQVDLNPENTIFGIKRLIGKQYDDFKILQDLKNWPFEVINHGGKPKVLVKFKGECKMFNPEEISAMVLRNMKETAERHLKQKVIDAVITVPAYFTDSQRQATMDAGKIAGLNVLRLINEPTAAALAYGLERNLRGEKNVLVFDMGGGTFDVSIVSIIERSMFKVRSTAGNAHLGGADFDNRMVAHCVEEFKCKHRIDIESFPISLMKLRTACEKAKRTLSIREEASIEIDALFEDINFYSKITRDEFEEMCMDLFCSTLESVDQALADATLSKGSIHDIVLVGGSTLIPKIRNMLRDFFNGKGFFLNPDRVVAYGAAVQAAVLTDNTHERIKNVQVVDVAPFSIGFHTVVGTMLNIVERNSHIPYQTLFKLAARNDGQPIYVNVYEKLDINQIYNLLGKFTLPQVLPVPAGMPLVELKFDLDHNGILSVSVMHMSYMCCIPVLSDKGCLSKEDFERIFNETKQYENEDAE